MPTLAPQGHAAVLRDHQFQNGLLQIGTAVFGVARRDRHGRLIAVSDVLAGQGKAGRVEMMAAPVDAFLATDRQGEVTQQPITALGVDCIERTAECKTVEQRRVDTLMTQQVEGCAGKQLGHSG